jgi:uncharacterized protein
MVMVLCRIAVLTLVLLIGISASAVAEPPIPTLTGRVVDQAGILDQPTIDAITSQLAGYESATGKQLVVVTLPDLKGYPIEDWGLALGRGWGIGQKGKNDGVLLIVAPNDRDVRIEVGYGLEGDLPDATANTIIQSEIIPHFKRGDMQGGVRAGVTAILGALGGSYKPPKPLSVSGSKSGGFPVGPFKIFALIFIAVVVLAIRRDYGPGVRRGRRGGSSWSSGFSSGSGFGGRSSGGGFSGGGGSFGGGGASGRW